MGGKPYRTKTFRNEGLFYLDVNKKSIIFVTNHMKPEWVDGGV